ncbi:MAG: hypothetical protein GC160_27315 [Acidobacteria bacterium]|nr:hypothetical protein [Acidobacteriota bacterium]
MSSLKSDPEPSNIPASLQAHLDELADFLSEEQEAVLRFLVRKKYEGRWKAKRHTGKQIMFEYYCERAGENGEDKPHGAEDVEGRARQEIGSLRGALEEYYRDHLATKASISIPLGRKDAYEPEIASGPPREIPVDGSQDFRYLGDNNAALRHLLNMIPAAEAIEDTGVRWILGRSLYDEDALADLTKSLQANPKLVFRSVTGPIVDEAHTNALWKAYRDRPGQATFRRLHFTAPLMNFLIVHFPPKGSQKTRRIVYFGYGRQGPGDRADETAVFFSENDVLVKEFMRLFRRLQTDEFSREISLNDPDLLASRDRHSDILATFKTWPVGEITDRILRPASRVAVCITAWPTLDVYLPALRTALEKGCAVDIALWDRDDEFVALRGTAILGDREYVARMIDYNKTQLAGLLRDFGDRFTLQFCKGWASVSVIWIDDLIFWGSYWMSVNAVEGPLFLAHMGSPTGQYLQRQYRAMVPAPPMWLEDMEAGAAK